MTHRMHDPGRPLVPDALPLARDLYENRSSSGCCLHIVLDDCNLEDSHVDFCVHEALRRDHVDCYVTARTLRAMTRSQRGRVYRRLHEPRPVLVGDPVDVLYEGEWLTGVVVGFDHSIKGEPWPCRANVRCETVGLLFRGCHPSRVRRSPLPPAVGHARPPRHVS